jgi:hypothetical protein
VSALVLTLSLGPASSLTSFSLSRFSRLTHKMGCKGEFEWCFLMDDDGDEKNNFLGGLVERWVDIMIMMTMMIYLAECGKSVLSIFMLVAMSLVTRLIFDAGQVGPHTLGIFIRLGALEKFRHGLEIHGLMELLMVLLLRLLVVGCRGSVLQSSGVMLLKCVKSSHNYMYE